MKHTVWKTAYLQSHPSDVRRKFTSTPIYFFNYQHITQKYALLRFHPVDIFLYFGHSADPDPQNYFPALVLNGTRGWLR